MDNLEYAKWFFVDYNDADDRERERVVRIFQKKRRKEIGKKMHDDKRVEVRQPITKNDEPQPNTDG